MARLLTAGFETGSLQELNGAVVGDAEITTSQSRTGNRSLELLGTTVHGGVAYVTHIFGPEIYEAFFRIAFRVPSAALPDGNPFFTFDRTTDGQDGTYCLWFDGASQQFNLYGGAEPGIDTDTALLTTGITILRPDIWYLLEIHLEVAAPDPVLRAGTFTLKVNGVTDLTAGVPDVPNGHSTIWAWGPWGSSSRVIYLDDLAINDANGSFENSWIGLGGVFFLKSNADGATTEWTPSAGSDHYALVNEVPANITDWVQGENAGDLELFDIEDTPSYVTAINVVQPVCQAALAVSGSNEIQDVVRADGANYEGATTHVVVSAAPDYVLYRGEVYYEHPDGISGALVAADLDALQVGWQIPA